MSAAYIHKLVLVVRRESLVYAECFRPKYPKKQWPPEEKKPMKNDDYDRLSNHSADDR